MAASLAGLLGILLVAARVGASAPAAKSAPPAHKGTAHRQPASPPTYTAPPLAPGDTLVARVGSRNITLKGFRDEWTQLTLAQRPVAPDPVTAYRVFLDDLVSRELLSQEAQRVGEKLTPAQEADVDSMWHALSKNQLFLEEVQYRVPVDTTQIDRFRGQLQRILFLTAYVFPSREAAQAWYTRSVSGTPVSRLDELVKAGGPDAPTFVTLGNKIREDFDTETANILFSLPPGRLSRPLEAGQGQWGLFVVVSSRVRANGISFASKDVVINEMRRLAANAYKGVFRDSLVKSIHLVYHEVAMDTLLNRFLVLKQRTAMVESGGASYNMFQPLPVYQPGDSALVLATSDLGRVTGGDLYRFLANMGDIERPEIRSVDAMRPWVDRVALDQTILRLAFAKGYDKDPDVLSQVQLRRERYQVQALYADSISAVVHVSEAEARDKYAADTLRWLEHETVRMWVCALPTRSQADSVVRLAKAGGNMKEMAYKLTLLDSYSENGGMTLPFVRGQCPLPTLTDSIFATPVGSFGGPVAANEGWVIFKILEHKPDRMRPFDEVHNDVVLLIRNDREEAAMQLLLERLRKRYPVEKHEQWLAVMAGTPSKVSGASP